MDPVSPRPYEYYGFDSQEEFLHSMRRKLRRVSTGPETDKWLDSIQKQLQKTPDNGAVGLVPVLIGPNVCALAIDASPKNQEPVVSPELTRAHYRMMNTMNGILFGVQDILGRVKQRDNLIHGTEMTRTHGNGNDEGGVQFGMAPAPAPAPGGNNFSKSQVQYGIPKPGRTPPVKRPRNQGQSFDGLEAASAPAPAPAPRKIKVRRNIIFFKEDEPMDVDIDM